MYLSFQFQMNKNEIEICEFEMHLENCFVYASSNLVTMTQFLPIFLDLTCSRLQDSGSTELRKHKHEIKLEKTGESPQLPKRLEQAKLGQVRK